MVSIIWAIFVYLDKGFSSRLEASAFVHPKLVLHNAKQRATALVKRYARCIAQNADKRGEHEFSSVASAYEQAKWAVSLDQGPNHYEDQYDKLAEKYGG